MPAAQVTPPHSTQLYRMSPNQLYLVSTPLQTATEGGMAATVVTYAEPSACRDPLHAASCSLPGRVWSYILINKQKIIPLSMSRYKQAKQAAGPHLKRCYINCKKNLLNANIFGKTKSSCLFFFIPISRKTKSRMLVFLPLRKTSSWPRHSFGPQIV